VISCAFVITLPAAQTFADHGNISIVMSSVHSQGLDTYPDFVISRIMAYHPDMDFPITLEDFPRFTDLRISNLHMLEKERLHNFCQFFNWQMNLRGQMSTVFTYTCLIGELKQPPPREVPGWETTNFSTPFDEFFAKWLSKATISLMEAVNNLLCNCAIHFHQFPDAPYVIILPAVGPYWTYAKVEKGDVPTLEDYLATEFDPLYMDRDPEASITNQRDKIESELQGTLLLLGTKESDRKLTKVWDEVFHLEETFPVPAIPQKKIPLPLSSRYCFLEPMWKLIA
jgi:hypothetical protein